MIHTSKHFGSEGVTDTSHIQASVQRHSGVYSSKVQREIKYYVEQRFTHYLSRPRQPPHSQTSHSQAQSPSLSSLPCASILHWLTSGNSSSSANVNIITPFNFPTFFFTFLCAATTVSPNHENEKIFQWHISAESNKNSSLVLYDFIAGGWGQPIRGHHLQLSQSASRIITTSLLMGDVTACVTVGRERRMLPWKLPFAVCWVIEMWIFREVYA